MTIMTYYKQLTVKIELLDENKERYSTGTGILCVHQNVYYVLTAYHCINPKDKNDNVTPRPDGWTFKLYSENDDIIVIKRLVGEIKDKDIAAIEVRLPNTAVTEDKVQLFTDIVKGEKYMFRGFPRAFGFEAHSFHIDYNDDNWWHFVQADISAERKEAIEIMEGASGSGIFFCRREKYFIVGIILHLHDETGALNEVCAAPIEEFKTLLPATAFYKFSADMLEDWEKELDEETTKKQIEELKAQKIDWVDNIQRKLKMMYPEQWVDLYDQYLGYYVMGRDFFIKEGERNKNFRDTLSKRTEKFFSMHQKSPRIYVDTIDSAISKYENLRAELVNSLADLFPEDDANKTIGYSYADYRLSERLLKCFLEYIKRP